MEQKGLKKEKINYPLYNSIIDKKINQIPSDDSLK